MWTKDETDVNPLGSGHPEGVHFINPNQQEGLLCFGSSQEGISLEHTKIYFVCTYVPLYSSLEPRKGVNEERGFIGNDLSFDELQGGVPTTEINPNWKLR
jgi:hypothetical protein